MCALSSPVVLFLFHYQGAPLVHSVALRAASAGGRRGRAGGHVKAEKRRRRLNNRRRERETRESVLGCRFIIWVLVASLRSPSRQEFWARAARSADCRPVASSCRVFLPPGRLSPSSLRRRRFAVVRLRSQSSIVIFFLSSPEILLSILSCDVMAGCHGNRKSRIASSHLLSVMRVLSISNNQCVGFGLFVCCFFSGFCFPPPF